MAGMFQFLSRLTSIKPSVLFGCVAENNPKYLSQALRLLQSLRWFGGCQAAADFAVGVVEGVDPNYRGEFEHYGAKVVIVPRYSEKHPPSNKLQLLRQSLVQRYDIVALLDCDTIIVQDPGAYLSGGGLGGKIADCATVPYPIFQRLFQHFGLNLPEARFRTTIDQRETIAYCNAGVLIFAKTALHHLLPRWLYYNDHLLENLSLLDVHSGFCEQASLALALAEQPKYYRELPLEMNFPVHFPRELAPSSLFDCDAIIIHYHWQFNHAQGFVDDTYFPQIQRRIAAFNQRLATERQRRFSNAVFWDTRYSLAPDLGSGVGSRGLPLLYKRELLRTVFHTYKPQSLLDVGCGDCFVSEDISCPQYFGVDVSPTVIESNQQRFPERVFIAGDFLALELASTEGLLCLDVLIHQPKVEMYRAFVRKLVQHATVFGVVSGYEQPPRHASEITFYHEPLSKTLEDIGVRSMRKVGHYRSTDVWLFERKDMVREPAVRPVATVRPVLLVGAMGSETTPLAPLLGRHPEVVYSSDAQESLWIPACGYAIASSHSGGEVCSSLDARHATAEQRDTLVASLQTMFQHNAGHGRSGSLLLTHNPHLCNKLVWVWTLFPHIRFLVVTQSLPAVVASLQRLFETARKDNGTIHYWPKADVNGGYRCWHCYAENALPVGIERSRCFPGGDNRFVAEYWLECQAAIDVFTATVGPNTVFWVTEEAFFEAPQQILARLHGWLHISLGNVQDVSLQWPNAREEFWRSCLHNNDMAMLREVINAYYDGQWWLDETIRLLDAESQ